MNYINKIKPYSLKEIFKLIQYTFGSILINRVPKQLKYTYHFTNRLTENNISFKSKNGSLNLAYPIDKTRYNFKLKRNSSDAMVFDQIIIHKEYEAVVQLIKEINININTIVDVGANIGLSTIYFKRYFPDSKIICLEPSSETYKRLVHNIEINKLSDVLLIQKGLWSETKKLAFDNSFRDRQDWSFRLVEAAEDVTKSIQAISMNDLMNSNNLETIDFLKIDIEGGEKELFEANNITLWLGKIKVIALEIHDEFNCRKDIENTLVKFGFELSHSGELTIGINRKIVL